MLIFAVLAGLLIGLVATMAILVLLLLSGVGAARGGAVATVVTIAVCTATTLVVPLRRADHATLGQMVFLTPAAERPGSAVWRRFLIWWLPAALLQAVQHTGWVLLAAAVLGLLARLRPDRRTPVDLLAGSTTVTTRR